MILEGPFQPKTRYESVTHVSFPVSFFLCGWLFLPQGSAHESPSANLMKHSTWTHVFCLGILPASMTRKQIVWLLASKDGIQCDRRLAGSRRKTSYLTLFWVLFNPFPSIFPMSSITGAPESKQMKWFRVLGSRYHSKFLTQTFKISWNPIEKKKN